MTFQGCVMWPVQKYVSALSSWACFRLCALCVYLCVCVCVCVRASACLFPVCGCVCVCAHLCMSLCLIMCVCLCPPLGQGCVVQLSGHSQSKVGKPSRSEVRRKKNEIVAPFHGYLLVHFSMHRTLARSLLFPALRPPSEDADHHHAGAAQHRWRGGLRQDLHSGPAQVSK